ncbi:MAG: CerR family C-terminal domain-containing protein [Pseudomonadota bacterium]
MTQKPSLKSTKLRILGAAGDIFGRQGFKTATVRAIAKAAKANVASINYHFRDKEGLYSAVLEDIFTTVFRTIPVVMAPDSIALPEQRLRFFIRGMFHRFLSSRGWAGLGGKGKLIAREFLDPTPALATIVSTYIRPHRNILVGMIGEIAQADPESEPVQACALSIIGQCIYYAFAENVIQQIAPGLAPKDGNLDHLADHVTQFSLGGILAVHSSKGSGLKSVKPRDISAPPKGSDIMEKQQ